MDGKEYLKLNRKNAKKYSVYKKQGYVGYFKIESDFIEKSLIISQPHHHVFAGYYDINNVSPDGRYLFFLSVSKHASPKHSKADIYLYELATGESRKLTSTKAWCWQQGARVRWNPNNSKELLFNDYRDGSYLCMKLNIENGHIEVLSHFPLYDIDFNKQIGYGLDFKRLQKFRPGYGYCKGSYCCANEHSPKENGLYAVDLLSQRKRTLFSLSQLASQVESKPEDFHYLNHICVSPSGKRVMFFHLWTRNSLDMWKMRLLVTNADGTDLKEIECSDTISHYSWIDDDRLMVTRVLMQGPCYIIYNCENGTKRIIENNDLINDGHPSFLGRDGRFISDTYPLTNSLQTLFMSNINGKSFVPLLTAFSDPRYFIEKRCDMHPRLDMLTNTINVDSTFSDGLKKIILLKMGRYCNGGNKDEHQS